MGSQKAYSKYCHVTKQSFRVPWSSGVFVDIVDVSRQELNLQQRKGFNKMHVHFQASFLDQKPFSFPVRDLNCHMWPLMTRVRAWATNHVPRLAIFFFRKSSMLMCLSNVGFWIFELPSLCVKRYLFKILFYLFVRYLLSYQNRAQLMASQYQDHWRNYSKDSIGVVIFCFKLVTKM